ncbi:NAD(+)/NADH kinase [Campylobacter ureolyticus]|uniref:NAD(+)/NADH kinase n=1 Tax=Campylobacter ureolyticus TaxID=827 RepID=UPI0022B32340|nr:NAD(+)/NADH kinase [Campylobacter ureolyticus]MCZ6174486.1 NAD(+)/NADH kinase [Campylobacter ureolyticus]MCZ6186247.1 NAD(+)/NADH kinase [Campylobacter ureolyticus]
MNRINLEKNLKYIGIVAKNPKNCLKFVKHFESLSYKILFLEKTINKFENLRKIDEEKTLILSIGGDGTLISTCREIAKNGFKNLNVLGVYDGTLGFLTDVKINNLNEFFADFLKGKYEIKKPLMLEISLKNSKNEIKLIAFNDLVLSRSAVLSMSKVDAYLDDEYFNTYYGDGVIVSSPVGSTAYNMSANGPIIYPMSKVFCITPICAHSLTQRPLVLPAEYKLKFKNVGNSKVSIIIDGQNAFDMSKFDEVVVRLGNTHANLIRHLNANYFEVLKNKLHWGHNGGKV